MQRKNKIINKKCIPQKHYLYADYCPIFVCDNKHEDNIVCIVNEITPHPRNSYGIHRNLYIWTVSHKSNLNKLSFWHVVNFLTFSSFSPIILFFSTHSTLAFNSCCFPVPRDHLFYWKIVFHFHIHLLMIDQVFSIGLFGESGDHFI